MKKVETLKKLHFGDFIITEKGSRFFCCAIFLGVLKNDIDVVKNRIITNLTKESRNVEELQDEVDKYMTYVCLNLFTMEIYSDKEFMLGQCLFLLQNMINKGLRFTDSDMLVHYIDTNALLVEDKDVSIPDVNVLLVKEKMLGTDIIEDIVLSPSEARESLITGLKEELKNQDDLLQGDALYNLYKNRGKVLENTKGLVFRKENYYTTGVISRVFHAYYITHSFLNKKKVKVYSLNNTAYEPRHYYVQTDWNEIKCLKELLVMLSKADLSAHMYFNKPNTYYITDSYFDDMFTLDLNKLNELEIEK